MLPKISIVTPSFNQGKYLEQTICSILDQNYPNLEYIIVDGGSTDESGDIIKKYSSKLSYWIIEKDSGQSEAINKGLRKSTGDIVTWIASDDLLSENSLNRIATIFSTLPRSVGLIHGNAILFNNKKNVRIDKGYPLQNVERKLAGMTFAQPSSFIRRSFLDETGLLNTNYHYGMDYDLFSRLSLVCEFHYADELFSKYRLHENSKSETSQKGFAEDWKLIFNSIIVGLDLTETKRELEKTDLICKPDNQSVQFFEHHRRKVQIDQKLLSYYFLSNMIKYDYISSDFQRAKKIAAHLRSYYVEYLRNDAAVELITKRIHRYPEFLIAAMRRIKRSLI